MAQKMPKTPLATPLSGSARAAEGRVRNIFQQDKRRPPAWLLALCAAACLLCGGLVSCQSAQAAQQPAGPPDAAADSPARQERDLPFGADGLPVGTYEQVCAWLEEYTRDENSSPDARNTSAMWRVLSLICPDRNAPYELVLTAQAANENAHAPTAGPISPVTRGSRWRCGIS